MKRVNLTTSPDISRTLNRIANAVLSDEISPQKANALIFACNAALSALKTGRQVGDEVADTDLNITVQYVSPDGKVLRTKKSNNDQ